jgi:hypothetical protein
MKILISNNENIDSPISLKKFIIKKYKLNDLQLFAFERFIKMNSTNQLLQYIGDVVIHAKHESSKLLKNIF